MRWLAPLLLIAVADAAPVPDAPDAKPTGLLLAVGETVQRNVGVAIGYRCDDPTIVDINLVTVGDHNVATITGVKLGTTQCRVGTDPHRHSVLYEVTVTKPKKR